MALMMTSILFPCYTSFSSRGCSLRKQNHHLCRHAETVSAGRSWNFVCRNTMITTSISCTDSVGVPLGELPSASFDHYMDQKGRVIQAVFPEKSTTVQQLKEEHWRVKMSRVQILFLTCQPVLHVTARCISEPQAYPPEIPGHISKLFQIHITRCELQDLHADYIPQGFNLNAGGALYLERQGMHNWIKYRLDASVRFDIPPLLAWVPKNVLQSIVESIQRNYADDISKGLAVRLLADYNSFQRKKTRNLV